MEEGKKEEKKKERRNYKAIIRKKYVLGRKS